MEDVRQSDLVIVVGADPLAEGPMLAVAIRQAVRNGGRVVTIDPRPVTLPCKHQHCVVTMEKLPDVLQAISRKDSKACNELLEGTDLVDLLASAEKPVLIGGSDLLGECGVGDLCAVADSLASAERHVGVMTLLTGPNSFAGAMLAGNGPLFDTLLDRIQEGKIKALVCMESDPYSEAMDPSRAQAALGHLDLLVTIDATPTLAAERADIFLPSRANAEMAGSYINNEGRLQTFLPVIDPGVPIRESGAGDHPPREFFRQTPGSQPEPDWWLLARLLGRECDLVALRTSISASDPRFDGLATVAPETAGVLVSASGDLPPTAEKGLAKSLSGETLQILAVSAPVGSCWLAHLSAPLAATEPQPYVLMHPALAEEQGLAAGDRARLTTHFGHCTVEVRLDVRMVENRVLVPQLWDTALEGMVPGSRCECRLDKEVGS